MAKDLTLVLKVDANQFKTQMDQATRQVQDFGKKADQAGSDSLLSFNKLKGGLDNLRGGLSNLFATMAGGGFAAFVGNLINAADATVDLADATGLSIEEIKGLEMALNASGGKAENAAKLITKLAQTFDDAFTGSKQAQRAFLDLGFSLNDLNKYQGRTGELMEETIRKLAALGPGMNQTAAATQIFGKSIAGVDLGKLITEFEQGKISAAQFSESIRKAGELSDKAAKLMSDMGNTILKALEPVIDHFNNMEISAEDLGNMFKVLGGIVAGLALVFAPVVAAVGAVIAAIVLFADKLAPLATLIVNKVNGAFESMVGWLKQTRDFIVDKFYAVIDGLSARFAGLAAAADAIKNMENPIKAYNKAVEESLAASDAFRKSQKEQAEAMAQVVDLGEVVITAKREQAVATKQATDAWAKEKQAILDITQALRDNLASLSEKLNMDTKLIGVSDQQKRQMEAYADIEKKTADTRAKLQSQRLTADKEVIATIDRQLALLPGIEEQEKKNYDAANQTYTATKLAYDMKIQGIKDSIDIMTREYDLTMQLGNIGVESAKRIKDAEFELQTQALTPREQQIARLLKGIEDERQAKLKSISDQIEAETRHLEIQLENDTLLTETQRASIEAKILANEQFKATQIAGINEVFDKEKERREQSAKETYDYQQSFQGGWKSAYDNFINNTASAASVAKGIFGSLENTFVNAFTQMVTTGKIQFKDLINSMIKELVRLAAQQAFKWFLSLAGGPIGGFFAKLLPFADGGYVPTNGPILVGERGPEIISGMGGRTVTPNDKLGDVLGGGGGSVNYYITAVDSASFKQMIARDPEFLYAVTEKGRQRSPVGR
jgi:phage-related minor tail protein